MDILIFKNCIGYGGNLIRQTCPNLTCPIGEKDNFKIINIINKILSYCKAWWRRVGLRHVDQNDRICPHAVSVSAGSLVSSNVGS